MAPRVMTIGMALLSIGACGLVDSGDPPSIAGRYDLVAVNGTVLPCCAQVDSTGTRVTFVGGSLTLKEASPEPFAATPAGWMPESCVHGIPNGAHVDTSGVVTLPDGTQYRHRSARSCTTPPTPWSSRGASRTRKVARKRCRTRPPVRTRGVMAKQASRHWCRF